MGIFLLSGFPVMVVGPEGCGKSCAVSAAMYLSGSLDGHQSLFLTADTEASALVGAYVPAEA